ncbi:hypothetical protein [Paraburkholderia sp.]|uniref:hypothetical protein n=1 Tax=Paraburkholderia sp. TaxID=1926495 RepID=UPI0039E247D1
MAAYPHKVRGRLYGFWHYLDSGRACYIASRKSREVYHRMNAWCIDVATLEECRARGIRYIGVKTTGKAWKLYLTLVDDFFDSPYSFAHWGETRQRGLPLIRFRHNPARTASAISSAMKLK